MHRNTLLTCAAALLVVTTLQAQGPAPGFRLYGPHGTSDTFLVDNTGTVVKTWPSSGNPGNGVYLEQDGTLVRSQQLAGSPQIGGRGGRIVRVAFDGTNLWDYQLGGTTLWLHHDIALLPNGNVLAISWDLLTAQDAIDAGRDPATLASTEWLPDSIVEIQQTGPETGDIVWEWHFMDHVIQDFDATKANFGVVADHPELLDINFPGDTLTNGEWNHCNNIAYDAANDIILLNSPFQDEFYLIDHSTTTAEAAGSTGGNYGKGGDILYRWGNPQSYDRGTAADQTLFFQHGSYIIPEGLPGAGNVLAFNNEAGTPSGQSFSSVVEIDIPSDFSLAPGAIWGPSGYVWEYQDPVPTNLYSSGLSSPERLPNGNTLVVSGRQAWLFEIDPTGQKVWEFFPTVPTPPGLVFQVSYYERYLWADTESVSWRTPTAVDFDLITGTANAGDIYIMLGSASGTSPGIPGLGVSLPLNDDAYLQFTATAAGGPVLPQFIGVLNGIGNATARLNLPRTPALTGLTLNHAFVVVDSVTQAINLVSNPVPLRFDS